MASATTSSPMIWFSLSLSPSPSLSLSLSLPIPYFYPMPRIQVAATSKTFLLWCHAASLQSKEPKALVPKAICPPVSAVIGTTFHPNKKPTEQRSPGWTKAGMQPYPRLSEECIPAYLENQWCIKRIYLENKRSEWKEQDRGGSAGSASDTGPLTWPRGFTFEFTCCSWTTFYMTQSFVAQSVPRIDMGNLRI